MSDLDSVLKEQKLYWLKCGPDHFSCLGFDVCENWSKDYLKWLGRPDEVLPENGTKEAYEKYRALCEEVRVKVDATHKKCDVHLVPQLVGLEGKRVKVKTSYGQIKRFWVGKSTGWMPIHLEIPRRGSDGGSQVFGNPFESVEVIG